ncbi:interleukin-17C [Eublepharis macularius]|uniref:Interleukin-17C n=1 Tax=Eublepharis macularius TaxID=481883 RepID=A0AA97KI42_EUBMA|nr:interleukin-17C [Eublepharis macularius]
MAPPVAAAELCMPPKACLLAAQVAAADVASLAVSLGRRCTEHSPGRMPLLQKRDGVDAKQSNGHHHHRRQHCFNPEDVPEGHVPTEFLSRTRRWDRHTAVQLVPYLEKETTQRPRRHLESKCPSLQLQDLQRSGIHERSISPWSYEVNVDEDRYPRRLAFAHCLCKGCIDVKTGRETTSLNSVRVFQEMMVLRRKPCKHNAEAAGFTLEVEYIKVPVACTCVLPQSSS